jgi:hypothetical protein
LSGKRETINAANPGTGKQIASQNSTKRQLTGKGSPALPGKHDAVEEHVQGYCQTYAR